MHLHLAGFENVQCRTIGELLPSQAFVKVFLGGNQSKLSLEVVRALQGFGSAVEYVQISGKGRNAVDLHIAFYIGRLSLQYPDARFTIVSDDSGFDPMIRHLETLGIRCGRSGDPGDIVNRRVAGRRREAGRIPCEACCVEKDPGQRCPHGCERRASSRDRGTWCERDGGGNQRRRRGAAFERDEDSAAGAAPYPESSIASMFKPRPDQKRLDALLQSLADSKKIRVDAAKVVYSLG